MYSPVSAQPHVRHLKQLMCHCLSRASRDWPCLISSPQPAQSGGEQRRAEEGNAAMRKHTRKIRAASIFHPSSLSLLLFSANLSSSLPFSPPSPLPFIPLSCSKSHTIFGRWSYQNQATRLPGAASPFLVWVCMCVGGYCTVAAGKLAMFHSIQQVDNNSSGVFHL